MKKSEIFFRTINQWTRRQYYKLYKSKKQALRARRERIRVRAMERNSYTCWKLLTKIDWMLGWGEADFDPVFDRFLWQMSKFSRTPTGEKIFQSSENS